MFGHLQNVYIFTKRRTTQSTVNINEIPLKCIVYHVLVTKIFMLLSVSSHLLQSNYVSNKLNSSTVRDTYKLNSSNRPLVNLESTAFLLHAIDFMRFTWLWMVISFCVEVRAKSNETHYVKLSVGLLTIKQYYLLQSSFPGKPLT